MGLSISKKDSSTALPKRSAGLLIILFGVSPVFADQFDTLNYSASAGILYDSNVYRLPSSVDPQMVIGNSSKSDRIRQLSLGINIDKKYSNQEVLFNANVKNNKYNTFTSLDYNGTAYKAAWNWSQSSKLNGTLGLDRTQTLNSFADIRTNNRNLITLYSPYLNADWWFQSNWHLLLGVANNDSTSSVTTANSLSYRTRTTEWGLKYVPADNSSIALKSRNIKGSYINTSPDYVALLDTGYTEKQNDLQVNWLLTGKSVLGANWMNIKRSYPVFSQRDYSAKQSGINYAWGITGETHLNMSINRSVYPWFDTTSSYYVTNTILISPGWQISSKTDIQMSLTRSTSDYRGSVVSNAIARYDVNQSQQIGLGWSPQRSVKFSAVYIHSRRTSNYSIYEFSDNTVNLSVLANF